MTSYELHLLGLAYEASGGVLDLDRRPRDGWYYAVAKFDDDDPIAYPTLVEALTAVLRDLGVQVPKRPSAERVASIAMSLEFVGGDRVKYLRSVDRLALLALLEGGDS